MKATGCTKLDSDLERFRSLVSIAPQSSDELVAMLQSASQTLAGADLTEYDAEAIAQHGREALDDMLEVRIALRNRIGEWQQANLMTRPVQAALRGVFRDGRYATDMIGELIHNQVPRRTKSGQPRHKAVKPAQPGFSGGELQTLVNPAYGPDGHVQFQSGDVLLVRGMLANSAAIARIGDIDSQFSHIGLIHVADDGNVSVIEALIERGLTQTPIEESLGHDLARAVVYRPRDPNLGAQAAALAKALVERIRTGKHPHIPYDFTMQPEGYEALFCSKLIRLAYASASDGSMILPTFNTQLVMSNRAFFDEIGVTAVDTFAPADMELEPAFDIVAEWRDYRNTALIRNQDVVMDMVFHWMDTHGHQLKPTWTIRLIGLLGRIAAYLPGVVKRAIKDIVPEVPRNMGRSTIEAIAMLQGVSDQLTGELMDKDMKLGRQTGRPLHPRDAYVLLEEFRLKQKDRMSYLRR